MSMYGFNNVVGGALFNPKPLRRLNPVLRCFSSRHRRRKPCETRERKELPPEISTNTVRLTCESYAHGRVCDVYLVGTRHFSPESAEQVKAVIEFLKPQAVFLELCARRLNALRPLKQEEPTLADLRRVCRRTGNLLEAFDAWYFTKIRCKRQISKSEFCVAYEEAKKCGARVFYGDRDIKITMARLWTGVPLWEKTLIMLSEFGISKQKAILHERDQYMSATILGVAHKCNSVVAVVGRSHLRGIQENWKKPVNLEELLIAPQKKRMTAWKKILTSVGVAVAGFCGIYLSITQLSS